MAKIAIVMMSADDYAEGRGRMAHVITNAAAAEKAGHTVRILFEGQGVAWLKAWDTREHKFTQHYGPRFDEVKHLIAGTCSFCTLKRFDVAAHAESLAVPILGEEGGHHDLVGLIDEGFQILTY
jgi:hypothetical protein